MQTLQFSLLAQHIDNGLGYINLLQLTSCNLLLWQLVTKNMLRPCQTLSAQLSVRLLLTPTVIQFHVGTQFISWFSLIFALNCFHSYCFSYVLQLMSKVWIRFCLVWINHHRHTTYGVTIISRLHPISLLSQTRGYVETYTILWLSVYITAYK